MVEATQALYASPRNEVGGPKVVSGRRDRVAVDPEPAPRVPSWLR